MAEFEVVFQREKALADRGKRIFALVVFFPVVSEPGPLTELARIVKERLRTADTMGSLDQEHLAAILPDTTEEGAFVLANALISQIANAGLRYDFKIYVYPGKDKRQGRRPAASSPAMRKEPAPGIPGESPEEMPGEVAMAKPSMSLPFEGASSEVGDLGEVRSAFASCTTEDLQQLFNIPISFRKRALDVAVASTALVLLAPVFALVAIAVKLTSEGPAIFVQKRAGQGGHPFDFYKFRSMWIDAEARKAELFVKNEADGPIFKIKDDPRMTPIGRFLRRTSLDELPQLYNVLKGDMTLVGPRPPTMDEVELYEPWQHARLNIRGGITCIWQVSGRSEIGFEDWVRMDLRYAQKRGLALDLGLLAKTANAVVSGRGAY
jgi:lipopolysaccharide/colanic/teichoic acid biosynthesis glycosyltransferase